MTTERLQLKLYLFFGKLSQKP